MWFYYGLILTNNDDGIKDSEVNYMIGNGSFTLDAPLLKSWEGLFNPNILEKCIMGCKNLTLLEKNKYLAEISIGLPPINGKYESIIENQEIEKWKSYKLIIKAVGVKADVEASCLINLVPENDNKTMLVYSFDAQIRGKATILGKGLLREVGKLIIQDFFKKFGKELKKFN